jgi:hypothetical protein
MRSGVSTGLGDALQRQISRYLLFFEDYPAARYRPRDVVMFRIVCRLAGSTGGLLLLANDARMDADAEDGSFRSSKVDFAMNFVACAPGHDGE